MGTVIAWALAILVLLMFLGFINMLGSLLAGAARLLTGTPAKPNRKLEEIQALLAEAEAFEAEQAAQQHQRTPRP